MVPYPDASFDFAVSEYGAAMWADPYKWIPEATRLLRPGGHLVFLGHHPLISITQPRDADAHATKELLYPTSACTGSTGTTPKNQGPSSTCPSRAGSASSTRSASRSWPIPSRKTQSPGDDLRLFVDRAWAHDYPSEQPWHLRKR